MQLYISDFGNDITARNLLDKLGITEKLNRPGVTEVLINRCGEMFDEDGNGFNRYENDILTLDNLKQLGNALCVFNSKALNAKNPIHSVTLPDGERGHIMMPPSCEDGTMVFAFRKPSGSRFGLDDYIGTGRLKGFKDVSTYGVPDNRSIVEIEINSKYVRDVCDKMKLPHDVKLADWQYKMLDAKANGDFSTFFQEAISRRLNICMVGGTGSGKTTFTKTLADMIDYNERLITIEDTHELDLPRHANHAHLFYGGHLTAKMIIAACMRLKPDRIFLTELRGDEAWDYLSALNTGHPGGLTSVHANDARSAHSRIANLVMESPMGKNMDHKYVFNAVRSTIDVICYFEKTRMTELYFDPVEKYYAMQGRLQ